MRLAIVFFYALRK